MCVCGKTFLPTTGTIFDDRKISNREWMEFCMNLFRHVSINADSWNNKNSFATSRYWRQKLFLTLDGVQDNIVLSGSYGWMKHSTLSGRKTLSVKKMEMNFEVYPETKSALGSHSTISTQYFLWKARGRHG